MCTKRTRNENIEILVPDVSSSLSCRKFVEELIKYVLVNRKVLPYPLSHLETINSCQPQKVEGRSQKDLVNNEMHKKKARAFSAKLKLIFRGLENEFSDDHWEKVQMIALLLGPTINCPKEVYLIKFPELFHEKPMVTNTRNDQMRHIVLNNDMMFFINKHIPSTNMFVLVLKPEGDHTPWAYPLINYKIPKSAPVALITLTQESKDVKKVKLIVRQKSSEVEEIINQLCDLKLQDKAKKCTRVVVHAKRMNPVTYKRIAGNIHNTLMASSSSAKVPEYPVLEMIEPTDPSKCCKRSFNINIGTDVEKDENVCMLKGTGFTNEVEGDDCCESSNVKADIEMVEKTETTHEKLVWYLSAEHLAPFTAPRRETIVGKKQKFAQNLL